MSSFFSKELFTNELSILYYLFPPSQVNHYSDSEQSTINGSSSINERSNTRNVLHSISGNGNLKVTQ